MCEVKSRFQTHNISIRDNDITKVPICDEINISNKIIYKNCGSYDISIFYFPSDNRIVFTFSKLGKYNIQIWNSKNHVFLKIIRVFLSEVKVISWSSANDQFITVNDNNLTIWSAFSYKQQYMVNVMIDHINSIYWSSCNRYIICVYEYKYGQCLNYLILDKNSGKSITTLVDHIRPNIGYMRICRNEKSFYYIYLGERFVWHLPYHEMMNFITAFFDDITQYSIYTTVSKFMITPIIAESRHEKKFSWNMYINHLINNNIYRMSNMLKILPKDILLYVIEYLYQDGAFFKPNFFEKCTRK